MELGIPAVERRAAKSTQLERPPHASTDGAEPACGVVGLTSPSTRARRPAIDTEAASNVQSEEGEDPGAHAGTSRATALALVICVTAVSCTGLGLINAALGLRVRETAVLSNI